MRNKAEDFGMVDALIVAQQRRLRCKVVSGDVHFEGVKPFFCELVGAAGE